MIVEGFLTSEQIAKYKGGGEPESIENLTPSDNSLKREGVTTKNDLSEFFAEDEPDLDRG